MSLTQTWPHLRNSRETKKILDAHGFKSFARQTLKDSVPVAAPENLPHFPSPFLGALEVPRSSLCLKRNSGSGTQGWDTLRC